MKKIHRITAVLLMITMLLTAGCGTSVETTPSTGTATEPVATLPPQTTAEPTKVTEPVIDPALNGLRQACAGTSQIFAVAYLGYHDTIDSDAPFDPYVVMRKNVPQLCNDLPFLLDIPQERVIGETGDLFCIIPADPDAAITISRGIWDNEVGDYYYKEVFHSDSGEPILLLCNNSGWEPDARVTVSNGSGDAVWYPMVDDNHCPDAFENENGETLFYDFTPYRDMLTARHSQMKGEWVLPTEDLLIGTTWYWGGWRKDGLETPCLVTFQEDTLYIRWNDGYSRMDYEYWDAPWQLNYKDDYAVLSIDLGEFGGVLCYNLLYHEGYAELYVAMDVTDKHLNIGFEPTYRYMFPAMMPETMDLEGTWELMWTEVDGYKQEAEAGQSTLNIYMTDIGLYHIDRVDNDTTIHGFTDKEIVIFPFEMYEGCENQLWEAVVNYGSDGVYYYLTLIYGDILEFMIEWPQDGGTGSARYYYRRAYE